LKDDLKKLNQDNNQSDEAKKGIDNLNSQLKDKRNQLRDALR